jgi:hyperosmotically inducible protein
MIRPPVPHHRPPRLSMLMHLNDSKQQTHSNMNASMNKALSLLILSGAAVAFAAGCAPKPGPETTGNYIDDSAITAKVKSALASDDIVKSTDIHVNTTQGIVQLSGVVDTSDQKSAAAKDAASVAGVKDVTNDLTTK